MSNKTTELQLQTGAYRTTLTGTEVIRPSTKDEWQNYGEILCRVEEAKQWAIGDWLLDGINHYEEEHGENKKHIGTGLYQDAERIIGITSNVLMQYKSLSETIGFLLRNKNLKYSHHKEVASIKTIIETEEGKLKLSDTPDMEKMQALLQEAEKDNLSVKELRTLVRQHKEEQQEHIRLANAPEKYSIIYTDPPWEYTSGDQHTDETQETVLGTHYASMTIAELCRMPIKKMAYDNALLFLWVTSPLLEEAFDVIKAWGFDYKTSMVWDKVDHNVGNYVSVRHELLLICARGTNKSPTKLVDSVYEQKRSKHSEKPDYFRELIDDIYPDGKRLELFARKETAGWDVWGNEV